MTPVNEENTIHVTCENSCVTHSERNMKHNAYLHYADLKDYWFVQCKVPECHSTSSWLLLSLLQHEFPIVQELHFHFYLDLKRAQWHANVDEIHISVTAFEYCLFVVKYCKIWIYKYESKSPGSTATEHSVTPLVTFFYHRYQNGTLWGCSALAMFRTITSRLCGHITLGYSFSEVHLL